MKVKQKNLVTETPAADSDQAAHHFRSRLSFETDCWDVHSSSSLDNPGFVLVDVRSKEAFEEGHVPGAVSIPHWTLTESRLEEYPAKTLFVTYCAGPHCNASTRGAIRLANMGRPTKEMIGGVTGWLDEGFELKKP